MKNEMKAAGEAFGRAVEGEEAKMAPVPAPKMATAPASQRPVFWLYNELGKLAHVESVGEAGSVLKSILRCLWAGEDAVFDLHDPLPFFLLAHLQMPVQLWQRLRAGQPWSILNFCLGQLR